MIALRLRASRFDMTITKTILLASLGLLSLLGVAHADTPANCTYEDIRGYWMFDETPRYDDNSENCSKADFSPSNVHQVYFRLDFPNVAVDPNGNMGTWTMIYNQGFEIVINYRRYFVFSDYKKQGNNVISLCDQTIIGWSHDQLGHNWACIRGKHKKALDGDLVGLARGVKTHEEKQFLFETVGMDYYTSKDFVQKHNRKNKLFTSKHYPEIADKSVEELIRMAGGRKSRVHSRPAKKVASEEVKSRVGQLPKSFDWRNVRGQNFVSPIRNQGSCGSCYAFASMGQLEARVRVSSNNTEQPVFSPQYIVDCSPYAQGCDGGFPYLIAGKFAQDYGVIPDDCYKYTGQDGTCKKPSTDPKCRQRTYSASYGYVGGYYGSSNEEEIMLELVHNGPVAVSFEVYPDFMTYQSGIYEHSSFEEELEQSNLKFNPFELTNHAVLAVGYGEQNGVPYWIVKNSWGESWGMNGYFWIRRGTDECAIESLGVSTIVIP